MDRNRPQEVTDVTSTRGHEDRYECVEPDLGEQIWRLDDPELDAAEATLLKDHLAMCDACRIYRAMDRDFAAGLESGSLELPPPADEGGPAGAGLSWRIGAGPLGWGAGLALAAGLALVLLLPPQARDRDGILRSGVEAPFERPVEGEVIGGSGVHLRWREIPGASKYLVRIDAVAGDYRWSGESRDPSITVPSENELPAGMDYRAYLIPVPGDLAPAEGLTVSFQSGSLSSILRYRVQAAPQPARWLGLVGVLLGCLTIGFRFRRS
jgi:Putative zinc-finger